MRKYNEQVHQIIVDSMRNGNHASTAAHLAGINPTTLGDWVRPVRHARERGETRDQQIYPEYWDLMEDMEKAEAEFEESMVGVVTQTALSGAPNTWQAAMTILERTRPERFGKRDALKIQGDDEHPLQVETRHLLGDESTREVGRDLLGRIAVSRAGLPSGIRVRDGSSPDEVESEGFEVPD
jgi:transposase-like protein